MIQSNVTRNIGSFGNSVTKWSNKCRAPNYIKNINLGAETLIIAPPCSGLARVNVHKLVQRKNQTESKSV